MEHKSIVVNKGHSITTVNPPPLGAQIRKNRSNRPPTPKSFRAPASILHERTPTNAKQTIHQKSLIQWSSEYGPWAK